MEQKNKDTVGNELGKSRAKGAAGVGAGVDIGAGAADAAEQQTLVLGLEPGHNASPTASVHPGAAAHAFEHPGHAATAHPAPTAEIDYAKIAAMVSQAMTPKLAEMIDARVAPLFHMRREEAHTGDIPVGQMADIMLNDGSVAVGGATIETVYQGLQESYMAELAFMNELVEVMLHETEDANAENPVIVGVNGIFKPFFRGVPTKARRMFVEGLIVKTSRVTTPEIVNQGGERQNVIRQHNAHKHAFSIIEDRNPKGREWLKRRMAEKI